MKAMYVDIAARWNLLAAEMERWMARERKIQNRENNPRSPSNSNLH